MSDLVAETASADAIVNIPSSHHIPPGRGGREHKGKKSKVLLVEDNRFNQKLIKAMLEGENCSVLLLHLGNLLFLFSSLFTTTSRYL